MTLPADCLARPFAHRGLHDRRNGVIENTRSAFDAAVAQGYGIELDVQMSRDGVPVVFHDPRLDRLTDLEGPVRSLTAEQLATVRLTGSDDVILPLADVLAQIGDRVPVLVEIKDQTCDLGPEQAVGQVVAEVARGGARLAVMSFRHTYIHALDWLPAGVHLGLTTEGDGPIEGWRDALDFISHDHTTLSSAAVAQVKQHGGSVLCWTIRGQQQADAALQYADQITFEGFAPA
ncbi:putative glycerophosphoryl diester phosphodiesterase 1 [Rhodobacteraceae bacterium THAF1]|uniref:glycerophosphodiester phosphodiesterase family protein n=1 Tax=Palleronia sp. THAF1 TaxID=2587842 RepID=UPI000F4029BD|nr:glycerophosphodiester phosphodiesterase family protein [Palleronia sp. THAF1]QFU10042.1 putative glycerophosphoryl diester phosphodiesterase 1 [Palleronia sp. THAF1]VDC17053.1 putative glycerophosphoryl diester phosphodiesterase 1 [Rhodobacteraceae bacterium THAF1]